MCPALVLTDAFRVPLPATLRTLSSEPLLPCQFCRPVVPEWLRAWLLPAAASLGSVPSHESAAGTGGFTLNRSRRLTCCACCGAAAGGGAVVAAGTAAAADGNRVPLNEECPPVDDRMLGGPAWLAFGVDTLEEGELRSQADDSVKRRVAADDPSDNAELCEARPVHPEISAAARDTADAVAGARSFGRPWVSVEGSEGVLSGTPVVTGGAQVCRVPWGILSAALGACAMSVVLALLTRCHASVNSETTAPVSYTHLTLPTTPYV